MFNANFGKDCWNKEDFVQAYSFRFTETPDFTQDEDCIGNAVNPQHREGFDNISLLTKECYSPEVTAQIHCSFEELGCPEIILVERMENCPDGAVRYGACFEVVLWKNGINVWRHYREEGRCFWHLRLGWEFPVAEGKVHALKVGVRREYLDIDMDGHKMSLRVEDLPEKFHMGITVCEGVARVYDMKID